MGWFPFAPAWAGEPMPHQYGSRDGSPCHSMAHCDAMKGGVQMEKRADNAVLWGKLRRWDVGIADRGKVIIEADRFYYEGGRYVWSPERRRAVWGTCVRLFREAMEREHVAQVVMMV